MDANNYKHVNRALWNAKTSFHVDSEFYNVAAFLKGETSLNEIELALLPDNLSGKKVLHLQCHFGQDSISLARMGADVTGVDISDKAIEEAKDLAAKCNSSVNFICSDVYALDECLEDQFDYVFASYGAIPWLPDLDRCAQIVTQFLKPDGELVFVEFHPFVWTFDDDFTYLKYDYFNTEAIIEEEEGTYADREADLKHKSITWNHPLSEVITALIANGMRLTHFSEYDYSPYPCFNNIVEVENKRFQIKGNEGKLPMVYAITATK